jgi:hypothetical protein
MNRVAGRMRRRASRAVSGRIRLGTAGASPRLRRWTLALVLLGVALLPYPSLGAVSGTPVAACRSGCRAGSVSSMIRWTQALPGSWQVVPGLTGTAPAAGLAYVSVGDGVAALGAGMTVSGYSAQTGAPLWVQVLTGFPAGAAIVSVRTWPGEVTAGVSYTSAGHPERTEVVLSASVGTVSGRYPAGVFGGAVWGSARDTVIVGPTTVTSYDNATGKVRWRVRTGPVPLAWRADAGTLYLAESAGGFAGSSPVTALSQINLATGADVLIRPIEGLSFPGTFSAAFDGVVLFSTATGVTAYYGTTGAWLWTIGGGGAPGPPPPPGWSAQSCTRNGDTWRHDHYLDHRREQGTGARDGTPIARDRSHRAHRGARCRTRTADRRRTRGCLPQDRPNERCKCRGSRRPGSGRVRAARRAYQQCGHRRTARRRG